MPREQWMAESERLMLLKTDAFGSGDWTIRVSLANLPTEQYLEVGNRILSMTDHIHHEWQTTASFIH